MKSSKQPYRPSNWTWATPALITVVSLVWYYIIAKAEGLSWVSQRFSQIKGMLWPIAGAIVAASITGWGIGMASSLERSPWIRRFGALTLATSFFALLGFLSRWTGLASAPDWLVTSVAVISGGCFAIGFAFPAMGTASRPVWPALVIPALLAIITTVNTESLGDMMSVMVLTALSTAVGKAALRRIGAGESVFSVAGALGLSLLIVFFRVIGACGWVSSNGIIVSLAVIGIVVRRELLETFSDCAHSLRTPRTFRVSEWAVLGSGFALTLIFWGSSLAPESGADAVGARSALPIIWERAGQLIDVPEIFASYMGLGGEIINLIALPMAGGNMAKITSLMSAFFLVGCITSEGRESSRLLSWIAAFIFFSSTIVSWQFVHGFVDMHVAFMVVASMLALESWISDRKGAWILVAGLVAGTAVSIKLHAGTMIVLLSSWIIYECRKSSSYFMSARKPLMLLGAGVAIGLAPSVIRSYMLTGNPIFPFANSVFASKLAALDLAKQLPTYGSGFSLKVLTLPFRTELWPISYAELGTYHPANLILAVFGLALIPWTSDSGRRWWVVSAVFWFGWIMTEQNLRYSLPALACTTMAIASSGGTAGPKLFLTSWVALLLVYLGMVLGYARPTAWLWSDVGGPAFPKSFLLGTQSAEQYSNAYLPSSALAKVVNAEFGTKSVVWQVPNHRNHQSFLGRTIAHPHGDIRQLTPLNSILPHQPLGRSDESICKALRAAEVTHVIWDDTLWWIVGRPESEWGGFFSNKFSESYLELEAAQTGSYSARLYRVRTQEENLKGSVKVTLLPWTEGEISVKPGMLIGVQAKWTAQPAADSFLEILGFTSDLKLAHYSRMNLVFPTPVGWHRQWQTIPEGVMKLKINRSPSSKDIEVAIVQPANL